MRTLLPCAAAALCLLACGPRPNRVPAPCPTAQSLWSYQPDPVIGQAGEPLTVTIASPMEDLCTQQKPELGVSVRDSLGVEVTATAAFDVGYDDYGSVVVANVTFTPPQGDWYSLTIDFKHLGGVVETTAFAADALAVSETLPFTCDSLQRTSSGWLCDGLFVRDLVTVHDFHDAYVAVVGRALWALDPELPSIRRYVDDGEGELLSSPAVEAPISDDGSFWFATALSTEDELAIKYPSRLELYASGTASIDWVATFESPLLEGATGLTRNGDWFYALRGDHTVCPFVLDREAGAFVPSACFDVDGVLQATLAGGVLITAEYADNDYQARAYTLVGPGAEPLGSSLLLPWPTDPDPFVSRQSIWTWQFNSHFPRRVFALTLAEGTLRFAELPMVRQTCYSACVLEPRKNGDLVFWTESSQTKVVYLP